MILVSRLTLGSTDGSVHTTDAGAKHDADLIRSGAIEQSSST